MEENLLQDYDEEIGTRVVISHRIAEGGYGLGVYIARDMRQYAGMETFIKNMDGKFYKLDIDDGEWCWPYDALIRVE